MLEKAFGKQTDSVRLVSHSAVARSECGESHGSNLLLMVAARLGSESQQHSLEDPRAEQSTPVPAGPGQHLRIQPGQRLVGSSDD